MAPDPSELAARLDSWIVGKLTTRPFELSRCEANHLVSDGRILPVLDGLDETDPVSRLPARAVAIIRALNHPVGYGLGLLSSPAAAEPTGSLLSCRRQLGTTRACKTLPQLSCSHLPSGRSATTWYTGSLTQLPATSSSHAGSP